MFFKKYVLSNMCVCVWQLVALGPIHMYICIVCVRAHMSECTCAHVCVYVCARASLTVSAQASVRLCVLSALLVSMCVRVCYCGWGQPELSSLMCLGGPGESRTLEGVDVSALRDL